MTQAGQDWKRLGAALAQDAALAPFAVDGALLLWNRDAGMPGYVNAAGRALLGGEGAGERIPAATRQRLTLLAGGLAPLNGIRLERLRLNPGFSAALMTCGCKLVQGPDGEPVLALAVAAADLRRAGIVVPPVQAEAQNPAEAQILPQAPASTEAPGVDRPAQPEATKPLRAIVRFLWQSDSYGVFTSASADLADVVGAQAASDLPGRNWADLIGSDVQDRDGGLAHKLQSPATWSGHGVLWRVSPAEGVRVELSGVPVLDAQRAIAGFRGFGVARLTEREAFGDALTETVVVDEAAPMIVEPAQTDAVLPTAGLEDDGDHGPLEIAADKHAPVQAAIDDAETVDEPQIMIDATEIVGQDPVVQDAVSLEALADTPEQRIEAQDSVADSDDSPADATGETITGALPSSVTDPTPADIASPQTSSRPNANVFPLRNGHLTSVRPVLEPSKPHLSSAERNAFREIAKALGARIAGEDEIAPRLPPAAKLLLNAPVESDVAPGMDGPASRLVDDAAADAPALTPARSATTPHVAGASVEGGAETALAEQTAPLRPRLPNAHADILDKLPIAVLVNRGDEALYANRTLLDLLDYADLADLTAGGSVSALIKEAARADGGAMILIDRTGHLVSVDAVLSSMSWLGQPATLMAFRNGSGGGEVAVLTPEEVQEAELAAEFEAEDRESAARVDALRMDVDAREARIAELVAMLDTATDGVVTTDERGRILSLNRTAEALFGYDQREVTGELFTLLFGAESHAPALDYLEGLKGGGVASVMNDGREVVGRVRQGGKIPLFMTMGQIAHGAERRFCAVLRDITAWKKTEGELVEARKAAEKASAQKSDVLAKISHEIRTPLNAIIGFAEVMAEERFGPIANERYKEYLRDIHQSGGYVISLVNDLLDLAKIEAGKLDLDFVGVNLNEIALSAVSLLQPEAQRGRVVLRSGLSPRLPPVVADERSIRQIVINLLSNAVKFTDAGGQVIVSTALGDQGEAILRVRDTGIGMDDSEIALALEPFRQVPTTRRKGGTGLGLPLTKALVEANRAAMTITSVKKEGTLVEITFPPQRVLAG